MGIILGLAVLSVALWLCWRMGVPLAGSLFRSGRRRPTRSPSWPSTWRPPTVHERGGADRQVSELETVPGHGTAEDGFDQLVAADPQLAKLARKTRA